MVATLSCNKYEPRHEIPNNVVCATSKASDQPAHTRSLIRAFYEYSATCRTSFGVSKLKRRLHRLVRVYTCQNATLLEITCRGSKYRKFHIFYSTCLCTFCILYINFTSENTSDIILKPKIKIKKQGLVVLSSSYLSFLHLKRPKFGFVAILSAIG